MTNNDVAAALAEVADLLAIEDANAFRVRAYRRAADVVRQHPDPVAGMDQAALTALPGLGKDLAGKIQDLTDTGHLAVLDELRHRLGPDVRSLLNVRGLGPKRVGQLRRELGVTTLADLHDALESGRVQALDGFGDALVARLRDAAEAAERHAGRVLWSHADQALQPLLDHLRTRHVDRIAAAGSYRRGRETVGDLDLLAMSDDADAVMAAFRAYPGVEVVEASGPTKTTAHLRGGLQVDLRVVEPAAWGAALVYFTGSKEHGIALRNRALRRSLKVNEYGVWDGEQRVAGAAEEDVYAALGLAWIPPELREADGEIDLAERGALPQLLHRDHLRGDLHVHTTWSDGRDDLETMVRAATEQGHHYLAITDHSPLLPMVNGLDAGRLARQAAAIAELHTPGLRVLRGCEVDILPDGSLDLPDAALQDLHVRVCSVHTALDLDADAQTARLLRAFENPYMQIWGHPTSRLLLKRDGIAFDQEAVLDAAAHHGIAIELNAQPDRLDASVAFARAAHARGIPLVVNTDAHAVAELDHLSHGIRQARRAGLSKKDVLNTRGTTAMLARLRQA